MKPASDRPKNQLAALVYQENYDLRRTELRAFADSNPAYHWLSQQEAYRKMQSSLRLRARKSKAFSRPLAEYDLLFSVAAALEVYAKHIESGTKPIPIGIEDLRTARSALVLLQDLQDRGLTLSNAVAPLQKETPASVIPRNFLAQMQAGVERALKSHRKPQPDERATDRFAAKRFTLLLLGLFDDAPTTMIEKFGELIDYRSDAIRRHVPKWVAAYRTGSIV
jgi:hypothetical protein